MYEEILSKVITAGHMRNLSERSISTYCKNLEHFFRFAQKDPFSITMQDVYEFILSKNAHVR